MMPVELRRQIFRGAPHWQHPCGISYGLQLLGGGGVALFSRPGFAGWATRDEAALSVSSLALDDCGRIFWLHRDDCHLYRRDPVNDLVERIVPLADCVATAVQHFGRMISAEHRLWVLDRSGSRLLTIRPDTFQIIGETKVPNAIDISYAAGRLFSLAPDGIRIHDLLGQVVSGPHALHLSAPIALGADPEGRWLYVIDGYARSFLRYAAPDVSVDSQLGDFDVVDRSFRPQLLLVHPDGNLFASDTTAMAHEFSTDGSYIGPVGEVSPLSKMLGLTVARDGEMYVGSPEGIARFSREAGVAGNTGQFYTRTLDNGTDHDEAWHRLDLAAELDAGGAIDVYYASAADEGVARAVSGIFDRQLSQRERVDALEAVLGGRWIGPHQLRTASATARPPGTFVPPMSHSVLFRSDTKRYLWLKVELSGLTPRAKASLNEMRVYYPRLSYLRYLPAMYQHDQVSKDFLERFLAMFETIFSGIEATVERIPELFDPELTPGDFLEWLAQWLDLGMEEDWPDHVKRRLVRSAARLYQRKGTPGGLAEMIEVITGTRPIIRESFDTEAPFILGQRLHLGIASRIFRPPMLDLRRDQRMVLGDSSILGASEIRATTQVRTDPFRASAHRFSVFLDLPLHRFRRYERGLHRIIRENAPAHVSYDIHLTPGAGLGPSAMLGLNLRVTNPPAFHLGYSTLGRSTCVRSVCYGAELGTSSTVTGRSSESNSGACSDGER